MGTLYGTVGTYLDYIDTDGGFSSPFMAPEIVGTWYMPGGLNVSTVSFSGLYYLRIYGTPTSGGTDQFIVDVKTKQSPLSTNTLEIHINYSISYPTYTHTINYNANGGSGSMSATTITDYNSGYTNVVFASNSFSPPLGGGYYFAGWRIDNTGVVYQPSGSYSVSGNSSVTAYAYWERTSYTITTSVDPSGSGTVTGGGTYYQGDPVTLTATPASHYHFVDWSDGTTSNPYPIIVSGNLSLTANFALDTYTVSASVSPSGTGSVSGTGSYNYGATATLTAVPDTHYKFLKWNDDTTANPKVFTVTQAVTYTATFGYAYPNTPVKVNGEWKDGTPYVKVNGTWVQATNVWAKVNGTWKESTLK